MLSPDTISAISSAAGIAARMIVRISGATAWSIASRLGVASIAAGRVQTCEIRLGDLQIPAWVYAFASPRSYTGEDLIELHIPGNPLLAKMLLGEIVALGARQAEAGEFTARAYFNGRMDLTEAEGVAATIAASNERQLQAARQLLGGELARRLKPILDLVAETLALIEVGIDFSDEDVTFLKDDEVRSRIGQCQAMLADLLDNSARLERLSHEPRIVLVGRPNAGKSTLLNALAGVDRAIVSPVAGTTRDVLSAQVSLGRGMIELLDAAGLDPSTATDPISQAMHERALQAIETSDRVVLVKEHGDERPTIDLPREPDLIVISKCDDSPGTTTDEAAGLKVSARAQIGLDRLKVRLDQLAFGSEASQTSLALAARHVDSIQSALASLKRAGERVGEGSELVAMELRDAMDDLGEILGAVSPDDLLGQVFSRFCIGK